MQANKEDFEIIAADASGLLIAIWQEQKKSENPNEYSPGIKDMVRTLEK